LDKIILKLPPETLQEIFPESLIIERRATKLLERAILRDDLNLVERLVNTKLFYISPEMILGAIKTGDLQLVSYLLEHSELSDEDVDDFLVAAAGEGKLSLVKYFLRKGASTESEAAYAAAVEGKLTVVQYLVQRGNIRQRFLDLILTQVAKSKNLDLIKFLVQLGANVSVSAITLAEMGGNRSIIDYLESDYNTN